MNYWPGPTFGDAGNACFCLGPAGLDKMAAGHVTQRQLHGRPVNIGEEDVLPPPASTNIIESMYS